MKTHRDYVNQIGETNATGRTYLEKRWNKYYLLTYQKIVNSMLQDESRDVVLDVGTSHGNWYNFLRRAGFRRVTGVELDPVRAELARRAGYDEVFNCDAADLPLEDAAIDVAVSNDVFVHILRLEDKAAVLAEVRRVLRPGGVFIINHSMSPAIGRASYHVDSYCSFLTPAEWIQMATTAGFGIEDVKPSYYIFRSASFFIKAVRALCVAVPFGIGSRLLILSDTVAARWLGIGRSDYVYLKLRKPSAEVPA
jgi:SAM-dependent methyltransferase